MPAIIKNIEWTPEMATGFASIDIEHITLVVLYNDCARAVERRVSPEFASELMKQVQTAFLNHFKNEERILRMHAHPEVDEHAKLHRNTVEKLRVIASGSGAQKDLVAVLLLLRGWILEHIYEEDRLLFASLPRLGSNSNMGDDEFQIVPTPKRKMG